MNSQSAMTRNLTRTLAAAAAALLLLPPWQALSIDVENTPDLLENLISAQEVYEDNCAACHGYDGVPMLPGAANFATGERLEGSDSELLAIILDGNGDMPGWRDELTSGEQEAALAYIRLFPGRSVIQEKCSSCHDEPAHELVTLILDDQGLRGHNGRFEICPGSDIEAEMSKKDFVEIDRYLKRLSELGSVE